MKRPSDRTTTWTLLLLLSLSVFSFTNASPISTKSSKSSSPTIKIGKTTYVGIANETTGIEAFKGIPFAKPPLGGLRLMPPEDLDGDEQERTIEALNSPNACIATNSTVGSVDPTNPYYLKEQEALKGAYTSPAALALASRKSTAVQSEDCLYLNVHRPTNISKEERLPIVIWIYGGGFESGDTNLYSPDAILTRSIEMNQKIIYVAMQYRLAGYGFMNGEEILKHSKANLGLLDQRKAIEWVHNNAHHFNGDKTKVTLMGESAGSISIGCHLASHGANQTDLYRAVIMESGSAGHLYQSKTHNRGFDIMSNFTNCSSSEDSFKCLQNLSTEKFNEALNQVPSSKTEEGTGLFFSPAIDGDYLPDYTDLMFQQGRFKRNVAILNGDEKDEGTYLTLGYIANITDDEGMASYIRDVLLPGISDEDLNRLLSLYPSDPSAGSPYGTGNKWNITGQNKRVASFYGDLNFWTPRRNLLQSAAKFNSTAQIYSYVHETFEDTPFLGAFHSSDLVNSFGLMKSRMTTEILSRWVSFIHSLDPSPKTDLNLVEWPLYGKEGNMLYFGKETSRVGLDDERKNGTEAIQEVAGRLKGPIG